MVERDRTEAIAPNEDVERSSDERLEAVHDYADPYVADEEPPVDDVEQEGGPLADLDPSSPDEVNPADLVEQRLVVPLDDEDYR